jgi:thiol:disulfide interchange protein DsbD
MHTLPFSLLALACAAFQDAGAPAPTPDGNRLVKVELLADRSAIRPNESFTLAARLTVEPGWHVYWVNPGDSGQRTHADFAVPAEFERGTERFPGPTRHVDEGDIVSFVLEGAPVILLDVQAPANLEPGKRARFAVDCRWLVCNEICLKGAAKVELELPVAAADAKPALAEEKLFAAARARIPRPFGQLTGGGLSWLSRDEHPLLQVVAMNATSMEFFPFATEGTRLMRFERSSLATYPDNSKLDLVFVNDPAANQIQGVLLVRTAQGDAWYDLRSVFPRN